MKRRAYLKTAGAAGVVALAGCTGGDGDTTTEPTTSATTGTTSTTNPYAGTLRVATYGPFVDAPSSSPGSWLKQEFEKQYPDATLQWFTPNSELNYFIQRKNQGVTIDADVYVGLNADDLVRIDANLDEPLFASGVELDHAGDVKEGLHFDPQNRAVPFDTGYVSLVYDETKTTQPRTFADLKQSEYAEKLLVQNAQSSDTGQAFLLWSIHTLGEDTYLDYWDELVSNGARVVKSWDAAYTAYSNGDRPIVVSYSTDQVYAHRSGEPLEKHQVGFLNDQGYANPEGMARFADTDKPELARAFMDFMLSADAQSKIPVLNVSFPATTTADLPDSFDQYAFEPDEPVTYDYETLQGNLDTWVEQWARRIASK